MSPSASTRPATARWGGVAPGAGHRFADQCSSTPRSTSVRAALWRRWWRVQSAGGSVASTPGAGQRTDDGFHALSTSPRAACAASMLTPGARWVGQALVVHQRQRRWSCWSGAGRAARSNACLQWGLSMFLSRRCAQVRIMKWSPGMLGPALLNFFHGGLRCSWLPRTAGHAPGCWGIGAFVAGVACVAFDPFPFDLWPPPLTQCIRAARWRRFSLGCLAAVFREPLWLSCAVSTRQMLFLGAYSASCR